MNLIFDSEFEFKIVFGLILEICIEFDFDFGDLKSKLKF